MIFIWFTLSVNDDTGMQMNSWNDNLDSFVVLKEKVSLTGACEKIS